ncbi:chemotaxis protein, partial [Rubrivivax gelatinosus]|nr:chemotaxis protein [Rubrivivax gelatinosus]
TGLLGRGFADFHQNPAHQQGLLEGLKGTYISQMRVGGRTFKLIANPVLDAQGIRLGTVVEWIDRTAEVAAEAELDTLLEAVAHGDFSQRLGIDGKAGFFRDLAEGMNNLTEIVSKALDDLAIVLKAVAQADLTKKIESRYKGRFADLKNDTNATVEQLERLVGRI